MWGCLKQLGFKLRQPLTPREALDQGSACREGKGRLPGPPPTEPGTEAPPALSSSGGLRVASVLSYSDSPSGHEDSQTVTAARESRSRTRVWRDARVSLASYAGRVFYHIRIS